MLAVTVFPRTFGEIYIHVCKHLTILLLFQAVLYSLCVHQTPADGPLWQDLYHAVL